MPKVSSKGKGAKQLLPTKHISPKEVVPNVSVYTDLPPDVHGQLRCYLILKLDKFIWKGHNALDDLNIVVKWWGEETQGTVFRCIRLPGIAKYGIKCGPKQFASYLNDMVTLTLDFIDSKSYRVQGEASISISALSKSNSIDEMVHVVQVSSDNVIGRIRISLNIIPIPKLFENNDEPTLDRNYPVRQVSVAPKRHAHPKCTLKYTNKENTFPSKQLKNKNYNDIIHEVLQRSKLLKEELVKAQLKEVDDIETIKNSIEANIDKVPPSCIKEVERDVSNVFNESKSDNTLDLLFGKDHIDSVLKKHGLDASLSSSSSTSTLNDTSLIEHLFYNHDNEKNLSVVSSDSDVDESPKKRVPIGYMQSKDNQHRDNSVYCNDRQNRDVSLLNLDPDFTLSYNKITALGRVNKCKLNVNNLIFDQHPPSGTYFVEYKLPIQDEHESKTITSRTVNDKSILFNHTNIFPLMFDEVLINQWDVTTVVFKIFYKEKIEDSPKLIAESPLRLRNVMHADRFEYKISSQLRSVENDDYLGLIKGVLKLLGGDMSEVFVSKTINLVPEKPKSYALNLLIVISCGKAIQLKDKCTINSYIVIRMIDSVDKYSSDIVWGSHHPVYNSKHMIPFTYTSTFIDRFKDNFIVIEVWNKTGREDKLIGICKLPTNQFNVSLNPVHVQQFVEQNAPVISVDGYMPIIDILSNERCGILQCTLALGSQAQLTDLMSQKNIPTVDTAAVSSVKSARVNEEHVLLNEGKVNHTFRVTINTVQDVDMFEGSTWGQTDCYMKFSFPTSSSNTQNPELKEFSTSTTNTAPFMKFNHAHLLSLVLSDSMSVQQYLSKQLEDNCLVFELWRRFYYPNIRDQMSARGVITLQQLSHLVSLNPNIEQNFHIPLDIVQHSSVQMEKNRNYSIGTMSLSIEYGKDSLTEVQHSPNYVQFVVAINRACGLQYAAQKALEEGAPALEYAATVGVDSYVVVEVSFAGIQRETSVRPRSFTPNFGAHFSITLPTLMHTSHSGPPTLAENLSKGSLNVSVFHQVGNTSNRADDILLCKTIVQLESLLKKHTGIHGWFALQNPTNNIPCLGGLEMEVSFGEITERELVIQDGCKRGWVPAPLPSLDTSYLSVDICVDKIWVPDHIMGRYISQHNTLFEDRECYIRTKFYNSEAVCSEQIKLSAAEITKDKRCYGDLSGCQGDMFSCTFTFTTSTNLLWCLREESLEIQVWLLPRGGADIGDTILGCGYISLSSLVSSLHFPVSTAQIVHLMKGTSSNMGGSGLHTTVTLNTLETLPKVPDVPDIAPVTSPAVLPDQSVIQEEEEEEHEEEIEGIKFRVSVDKCTNLPTTQYDTSNLCVYCTVHCTAHTLLHTKYFEFTQNISVDHVVDIKIPYSVFSGSNNTLMFVLKTFDIKHDSDSAVIGTATIDLAPLLIGFKSIDGWYLIEDIYSKDTFGQIKISVIPLELLSRDIIRSKMQELDQTITENIPETNFLKKPQQTTVSRLYQQTDTKSPDHLNIQNVFKSLSDIEQMIKNIGKQCSPESGGPESLDHCDTCSVASRDTGICDKVDPAKLSDTDSLRESEHATIRSVSPIKSTDCLSNPDYDVVEEVIQIEDSVNDGTVINDTKCDMVSAEEPCQLLLDTFDITVDTDCLSDTISDISQLLQDVREQSQNIDKLICSDQSSKSNSRDDANHRDVDLEPKEIELENKHGDSILERPVLSGECHQIVGDVVETVSVHHGVSLTSSKPKINSGEHKLATLQNVQSSESPDCKKLAEKVSQFEQETDLSSKINEIDEGMGSFSKYSRSEEVLACSSKYDQTEEVACSSKDYPVDCVLEQCPKSANPELSSKVELPISHSVATGPTYQFKGVPNFFMSAKQLSTTLTQIKERTKSRSSETNDPPRSSTPVLNRRTPLYSLMRQAPDDAQKARIARIFKQ